MDTSDDKAPTSTRSYCLASEMRLHQTVCKQLIPVPKNGLSFTDLCSFSDEEDKPCQEVFSEIYDDEYEEED